MEGWHSYAVAFLLGGRPIGFGQRFIVLRGAFIRRCRQATRNGDDERTIGMSRPALQHDFNYSLDGFQVPFDGSLPERYKTKLPSRCQLPATSLIICDVFFAEFGNGLTERIRFFLRTPLGIARCTLLEPVLFRRFFVTYFV